MNNLSLVLFGLTSDSSPVEKTASFGVKGKEEMITAES